MRIQRWVLSPILGVIGIVSVASTVVTAWDLSWIHQFGAPAQYVDATSSTTDATGAYLGGAIVGALDGQSSAGASDVYVRKYTSAGNLLWTRQFGTAGSDGGGSVAADDTGVNVAGFTTGTLPGAASAGFTDAFVRKFDRDGAVLWTTQFGTNRADFPFLSGLATHTSGTYVAGWTFGTFPGQPAGAGAEVFIARLDGSTGNVLWVRQLAARGLFFNFFFGGVAVDDTGVYVAATTVPFDGLSQTSRLRKFDFDGNVIWSNDLLQAGGIGCSMTFWEVAAYQGGVYVVGQAGNAFFEAGDDLSNCPTTAPDVGIIGVLRKYDADGDLLWQRRIKGGSRTGHDGFTGAKRVTADDTGVYVSANLTGVFAGYEGPQSRADRSNCPASDPSFFDQLDAYVRRYDRDGNVIWTHQFGGGRFEIADAVSTVDGSVYAPGSTGCQIDPSQMIPTGSQEGFIARFAIDPVEPQGLIHLIVGRVETLRDAGRVAPGIFTALVRHLEASLKAIDAGDLPRGRRSLEDFSRFIEAMRDRGDLTPAEFAALDDRVSAAIGAL